MGKPVARTSVAAATRAIAWKDLTIELRSRQILAPVVVLGALIIVILHFAFPVGAALRPASAPGALWVAILFGSILGLSRSLSSEVEAGGMTGLLVSPADRGALFLGKWLAGFFFALFVSIALFAALAVLFAVPSVDLSVLGATLVLGLAGWVAAGTLMSGMAVSTRAREVLLPIILFPLALPLVVPAVGASTVAFGLAPAVDLASSLALMAAYDVVYMVTGFLFFSHVVEG